MTYPHVPLAAEAGPVVVRLHATFGGHLLTVQTKSGTNVDDLRRPYTDRRTAVQAYHGMVALFLAGWTINAVVDFARTVAPVTSDEAERLLTPCEVAA